MPIIRLAYSERLLTVIPVELSSDLFSFWPIHIESELEKKKVYCSWFDSVKSELRVMLRFSKVCVKGEGVWVAFGSSEPEEHAQSVSETAKDTAVRAFFIVFVYVILSLYTIHKYVFTYL